MEGRLLLDVVVGQSSTILELFTGEDESLLVRWDTLLVLDLGLDVVDRVRGLDLEGDGLTREAEQGSARVSDGFDRSFDKVPRSQLPTLPCFGSQSFRLNGL